MSSSCRTSCRQVLRATASINYDVRRPPLLPSIQPSGCRSRVQSSLPTKHLRISNHARLQPHHLK
jgi:hypothetical protein